MQYNAIRSLAQQNWPQSMLWKVFRWLLWLAVIVYCIFRWESGFSDEVGNHLRSVSNSTEFTNILVAVVLMMPLNWLLETWRWRLLLKEQQLDTQGAWRGVWMGLVLGLWLPRLLSDYVGRVGELPAHHRKAGIAQAFLGQATLMASTLSAGTFGVIIFLKGGIGLAIIGVVFSLVLIPFLIWVSLTYMPQRVRKFYPTATQLTLSPRRFSYLQGLGHLRYLVFTFQYFLLLQLFLPELSVYVVLGGITWVYLAKSITPFLHVFGDLGIREASALLYFDAWGVSAATVMTPTILLWVLNVMVPAAFGGILWMSFRLKST